MNSQPPIKLFSWRRAILPLLAACGVIVYRAYEKIKINGRLNTEDILISGITLGMVLVIFAVVGWWANRPD